MQTHKSCMYVTMFAKMYVCASVSLQTTLMLYLTHRKCTYFRNMGYIRILKYILTFTCRVCRVCKNHHSTILVYSWCSCCWYYCYNSTCSYLNIKSETISLACPLHHYSRLILYPPKNTFTNIKTLNTYNHVLRIEKCMQYVLSSDVKSFACFAFYYYFHCCSSRRYNSHKKMHFMENHNQLSIYFSIDEWLPIFLWLNTKSIAMYVFGKLFKLILFYFVFTLGIENIAPTSL